MTSPELLEAFGDLRIAMPPQLQLEGGNVVIRLSTRPEDTLALHASVLSRASDRFRARLSGRWPTSREVTDSKTEEKVAVFEYYLIYTDRSYSLTDDKEEWEKQLKGELPLDRESFTEWNGIERTTGRAFQYTELAEGFVHHLGSWDKRSTPLAKVREHMVDEHKIMFTLLYNQPLEVEFRSDQRAFFVLMDVIALAQYYLVLPAIAERITAEFIAISSLWDDIAENPHCYLVIGNKLRSPEIFAEALRHTVGKGVADPDQSKAMFHRDVFDPEIQLLVFRKQEQLRGTINHLTQAIRDRALPEYQSHQHKLRRHRGPKVHTTWYAADLAKKSTAQKCQWIAASIFREKFDAMVFGESHWSHVEYERAGKTGGQVEAGSLFTACAVINAACNSPNALNIFSKNMTRHFASMFGLRRTAQEDPAALIASELRSLLYQARFDIDMHTRSWYGRPVKSKKSDYFTRIKIDAFDLPWAPEKAEVVDWEDDGCKAWEDFEVGGEVEAASENWLKVVGVD